MSITAWVRVAAVVGLLAVATAIAIAWRAEILGRAQLAGELAAAKEELKAADTRQRDRDAKLAVTLEAIEAQKRTELSPAEIAKSLVVAMHLPAAVTLEPMSPVVNHASSAVGASHAGQTPQTTDIGSTTQTTGTTGRGVEGELGKQGAVDAGRDANAAVGGKDEEASEIQAVIPGQDLKPIYDFALDCQECRAKLQAAQGDLLDERAKSMTLTKERDDALHAANGGSVLARIARASKWLLIGAAAGAAAGALASR